MRNTVGFMSVHPPTLISVRKMVYYVDFKDILQKGFTANPDKDAFKPL